MAEHVKTESNATPKPDTGDSLEAEIQEMIETHRQLVNTFVNRVDDKRFALIKWRQLVYDMRVKEVAIVEFVSREGGDPKMSQLCLGMKAILKAQKAAWDKSSKKLMDEVAADVRTGKVLLVANLQLEE